jgi:hypothetical protein
MDDQVELLVVAQLEPGAWEIEGRARDFREAQNVAVEGAGSLQVGHGEANVVDRLKFHRNNGQLTTAKFTQSVPYWRRSALAGMLVSVKTG